MKKKLLCGFVVVVIICVSSIFLYYRYSVRFSFAVDELKNSDFDFGEETPFILPPRSVENTPTDTTEY